MIKEPHIFMLASAALIVLTLAVFPNVTNAFPSGGGDSIVGDVQIFDSLAAEVDSLAFPAPADDSSDEGDSLIIRRGKAKKEKEKPDTLSSYFIDDSLYSHRIITWRLNRYLNSPVMTFYRDTLQSENIVELPFFKADVGATWLGVTGSATQLHDFFKRERSGLFPFADPYAVYMLTPDNLRFYNVKGPLSNLSYYSSGRRQTAEDDLIVLFTRNISPAWNAGIHYHKLGAIGNYRNQRAKQKTFSAFTSYVGKNYAAHAGYIYNSASNKENGGIANDFFIEDTVVGSTSIDVRLQSALNELSSNTWFLTHSYGVPLNLFNRYDSTGRNSGTAVYFGHSFEYSNYKRVYTDGAADSSYVDLTDKRRYRYYENYYMHPFLSRDSSYAAKFDNRFFIRLQPYAADAAVSKIDGGIGYSFDRHYGFVPSAYLYGQEAEKLSTGYVYGNAQGLFGKYFAWKAFVKYHFSGYLLNDLNLDAAARISLYPVRGGVHLSGRFVLKVEEQPRFFKKYYSNHFRWNNDFGKTAETRVEALVAVPDWNVEAGFKNSLLANYVYFNDKALPVQHSSALNLTSIHAAGHFEWKFMRFDARLLFQTTSDPSVVPLPLLSGNLRLYAESEWIKNVLNTDIGFDFYCNSEFYDYAYNPAAGMFHTQSEKKIGAYPWTDFFASFKWKRANIYVKFTNVAEGLFPRRYFSALHYPRTERMFRLGINWFFNN
ncbi:MAG: putative porin [Prevotellaceae bacterium]|jgi:hypothetical protein|nr:putative porin [Prevotellaceae bacterium]